MSYVAVRSGSGRDDSVAGTVGSESCIGGLTAMPPKDGGLTGAGTLVQARVGAGPTPLPLHCHLCFPRLGAELEGDSLMGDRGVGSQPRCWIRREVGSQPGQVGEGGLWPGGGSDRDPRPQAALGTPSLHSAGV